MIEEKEPLYFKEFRNLVIGKFDSIDEKFDLVNKRFDDIDMKFESIDKKFVLIDQRFESIDKKFILIDQRFEKIDLRFKDIDGKFVNIDKRFDQLEEKIEKEVESLAVSSAAEFQWIYERFDRLESNMEDIREYNRLIEQHIGRYAVTSTTIQDILFKDIRPRILALEKLA